MSDPTGEGLSPLSLLPPHTSDTNCKSQLVTCTSDQLAINWGSREPRLGFNYSLEWLTELRETLPHSYWCLIKDILRGINEEPDKEIHRSRSRKVPNSGASVPVELGCVTLLICGCVRQPYSWGFMEASSQRPGQLLTPLPAPLPCLENGGQGWKFQVCNHSLVLLVDQPPSRSPPRAEGTPVSQEIQRDLGPVHQ